MACRVLVDEGKLGWASENSAKILSDYSETLCIGQGDKAPPAGSDDSTIAEFCRKECCDLLTGDKRAYESMLDAEGVKSVQISLYAVDMTAKQKIYLVKIY